MNEKRAEEIFTGERFVPGIEDAELEAEHYQRYYSVLPLVKNKVVLDAACGEGYGTNILSVNAASVNGLDINEDAINRAKEKYQNKKNISFLTGSVGELPFADHSIDVVISFETIEHISEELQFKFLGEIVRVLKEDGVLVMSTPNKKIYSDLYDYHNEFHVKEFYGNEFYAFLKSRFQFVRFFDQYFEVVSVIDKAERQTGTISYIKSNQCGDEGKYYIAVASNSEIVNANDMDITHVMMNARGEYRQRIGRILELQEQVEARNEHLNKLDCEIDIYRNRINELENNVVELKCLNGKLEEQNEIGKQEAEKVAAQRDVAVEQNKNLQIRCENAEEKVLDLEQQVERLNLKVADKDAEMDRLESVILNQQVRIKQLDVVAVSREEKIKQLGQDAEKRDEQIKQLEQTIRNKEGHIELLLEVEREYEREKQSRTYRLALKFRKISLWLLPANSKRRFFAGLIKKAIRHPRLMLKMINP